MMEFKLGDVVEWTSQAQGTWKTKRGKIVEVRVRFNRAGPFIKVSVPPPLLKNGKPSTAKPKMYWPRLSALKHVSEVA